MKERIEPTPHQIIMGTTDDQDYALSETTAWKIVGRLKERGWIIVKDDVRDATICKSC